jgi:hypothetical protein
MTEDSLTRRQMLASLTGAVATLAGARSSVAWAQAVASPAARPPGANALNVEAVGYTDLDQRPAFKMAIRAVGDRWYLFTAHFYHAGWSVVDVTDPAKPEVVRFIQWPRNAYTWQVDLSGDVMITALEAARAFPNFGLRDPSDEGVLIWNISDPRDPRLLGQYHTGGTGTHRNFYGGGRYMHLAAGMPATKVTSTSSSTLQIRRTQKKLGAGGCPANTPLAANPPARKDERSRCTARPTWSAT